ncbi:MAG: YajQ family cyclic di-GMP-binding protein [Dehalococcoidales bacterium]|nr:YajQ family cyclic di-GMP-binding protein [Dehalococcoidales bacterium]
MPSMDVVSTVDIQSLDNAVNNTKREIATRFDFRNIKTELTLDRKDKTVHILSGDEWKVKTVVDILTGQCIRQKVDPKSLQNGKIETVSTTVARMDIKVNEGISKEAAQKMVKFIKSLKIKVQPAIMDDKVRVTGKQIDDLQQIMQLLKEQDYGVPLQFVNYKS